MAKEKVYSDAPLYVDGASLLSEVSRMVKNMTCDNKHAFGYEMIDLLKSVVTNFSLSFKENDKKKKLEYAMVSCDKLEEFEIHLNVVKSVGAIGRNQFINTHKHLGNMLTQTYGWIESLRSKIN